MRERQWVFGFLSGAHAFRQRLTFQHLLLRFLRFIGPIQMMRLVETLTISVYLGNDFIVRAESPFAESFLQVWKPEIFRRAKS